MDIRVDHGVVSLYFDVTAGWEQLFLLTSDNHHDSIYCNRELEEKHLIEAKLQHALILNLGDLMDMMQGKYDPRRAYNELREEYRAVNYYDLVINDVAEFLEPYAENIVVLARGNHEMSVLKNINSDPTDRLVRELNRRTGSQIAAGGFGGWVRLMFNMSGGVATGPRTSRIIKYFHGAGSEAPVTRGVIQTNRQSVYLPDPNFVVNGHNHHAYYVPIVRERLSNKGIPYMDTQHHIRVPGYKQDYADGSGGWMVERGGVPKPIGAFWIRMWYENGYIREQVIPDIVSPVPVSPVLAMQNEPYCHEEDSSEGDQ